MTPTFIAATIFLITYAVIATERLHKTIAALAGAMLIILSGIITQEQAFESVDWNVIFLLIGMMIIANTMRHTGVFTWLAVMAAKLGHGRPLRVLIIMCLLTAGASALLDNVTTVVLVAPVTIYLAGVLRVSPVPMLLAEVYASNIGGAATLIGDPPNILIGSAAHIHFLDFAGAMLPISILGMVGLIVLIWVFWRNELQTSAETIKELDEIDTSSLITNPKLLRTSLIVLTATVVGFFLHGLLHLEAATVAMTGAAALMVITRPDPHDILVEVEWTTLLFFVGLFIVVGGIEHVGLIETIADGMLEITGTNLVLTGLLILWLSAVASALVDNIPFTAAMIPLVQEVGNVLPVQPLWWALAMGADFGGNATIIGASANVIVASIAERNGYKITFVHFMKYGVIVTVMTLILSSGYLWLRYLTSA